MKKIIFSLFLVLGFSCSLLASNTVTQTTSQHYAATTTVAKQYASNCTAGSTLVAIMTADGGSPAAHDLSVGDDINGAWTRAIDGFGFQTGTGIFYFQNNASSVKPTVTGTSAVTSTGYLVIFELTGVPTSSVVGASTSQVEASSPGAPSITLTSVAANSTIIAGWIGYANGASGAPDSGYTTALASTAEVNAYHYAEYIADAGSSGNKTLTLNGASSPGGYQVFIGVEFKTTSGCTPDHLTVTDEPANADLGVSLGTMAFAIKDAGGTTCTSSTATVTLTKHSGTCTSMALGGTVSGAATAGIFTTTDVYLIDAVGSCSLDAASSGLTGTTTASITISCTPNLVVWDDFPASAALGASLGTTAASIRNAGNYTCIDDSTSTITLVENTASTWGDLHSSSNLTMTVTAGVAVWTDLYVDRSIGAGSVNATSSGLTLATSPSIDITSAGGPDTIVDGPYLHDTDNVTTSYYTHGNVCFLYISYFTNPIDVPTDNKSNSFVLKAVVEAPIGHEFSAWYMDASCTTGSAHVVTTNCTAAANCYPHTRLITYTFTGTATYVDSESGINDTGTTTVTTDAVTTVSSGNLALLGVTFLGVGSTNPMVDSSFTDDDGFLGAILVTAYKNGSLGSTEAPTLSWTTGQGATALIMIINDNTAAPTRKRSGTME